MLKNKFTQKFKNVLELSNRLAVLYSKPKVDTEAIILALSHEKGSLGREILIRSGMKPNMEIDLSDKKIGKDKRNEILEMDENVKNLINRSVNKAAVLEHNYVGTEHLLYALMDDKSSATITVFKAHQIDYNKLASNLEPVLFSANFFNQSEIVSGSEKKQINMLMEQALVKALEEREADVDFSPLDNSVGVQAKPDHSAKNKKKPRAGALDFFAVDLTDPAQQKNIDPLVGREKEINRVIQILSRRRKNNPVLIGDPGVGKTAIVEGLAKKIADGNVPDSLMRAKIFSLDISLLVAGASMRGDFESRLKQVIEEASADANNILFIDEIHNIVGAGALSGALDASSILKPALARGQIKCIGATTYQDYKKYIEEDQALERRFQPVKVEQPPVADALAILQGLKKTYEEHHLVKISDSAIKAAVNLSNRYIPEKFLPDKAIDLLDEACAKFKIKHSQTGKSLYIRSLEDKLAVILQKKLEAVKKENYPGALKIKANEAKLVVQIEKYEEEIYTKRKEVLGEISERDIAEVLAEIKQIPLDQILSFSGHKVYNLEKNLQQKIIGQDDALKEINFFIKRAKAGLAPLGRPLASFMFVGPSGVGKTETARQLAEEFFGSADKLIRLDMSEFGESFNLSRLIGSPAGYVGFKEGGRLTEAVKRNPHSLILFDEIEKAHPNVFNILLQILDNGVLNDATGLQVNFKNTIIVLTSNLGTDNLQGSGLGFDLNNHSKQTGELERRVKEQIGGRLKEYFKPEFLSRLDKIVHFNLLDEKSIEAIVKLELDKIGKTLQDKNISLSFAPSVFKYLANENRNLESGARLVRQIAERKIEEFLADKLLDGEIKSGDKVHIKVLKDKLVIN